MVQRIKVQVVGSSVEGLEIRVKGVGIGVEEVKLTELK